MYINELSLEVTRKCNLKCAHCMRGNAQNKTMSREVIFNIFKHIDEIGNLVIGGGEPSLAIETINNIYIEMLSRNVKVRNIYIVTNGKKISIPLLECFMKIKSICTDNEISGFSISNDMYHVEERGFYRNTYEYIDKMYEYNMKNEIYPIWVEEELITEHTNANSSNWFARGRAKNWAVKKEEYLDNLKLDDLENPTAIFGNMYICYNGDVVGDENMSYIDMKKYIKGNITNWDDLIAKLKISTVDNYNWCQTHCGNLKDCFEWINFEKIKTQIQKKD